MGPNSSAELFNHVGNGVEPKLVDEAERRALLAGTLADLSTAFAEATTAPQLITEPTLPFKLYALAAVQRTEFGVAGSNPAEGVRYNHSAVEVRASVAPHHDSYQSEAANAEVRTRAIKIDVKDDDDKVEVEFFGLNMYIPDADTSSLDDLSSIGGAPAEKPTAVSSLIIVSDAGKTEAGDGHVAGDTSVIAVRNKKTGDARVYALTLMDKAAQEAVVDFEFLRNLSDGHPIIRDGCAYIMLPTGQIQVVKALEGDMRRQAADEFRQATDALKGGDPTSRLSLAERAAARAALNSDKQS